MAQAQRTGVNVVQLVGGWNIILSIDYENTRRMTDAYTTLMQLALK